MMLASCARLGYESTDGAANGPRDVSRRDLRDDGDLDRSVADVGNKDYSMGMDGGPDAPSTLDLGSDAPPPLSDLGSDAPPPLSDLGPDAPPPLSDLGPDAPPPLSDLGPDAPPLPPDLGPDAPPLPPDRGPDAPPLPPDLGPDAPPLPPDLGPDAPPLPPDLIIDQGQPDTGIPITYNAVGSGTAVDPYLLFNALQWQDLTMNSSAWSEHFMLADDIDLSTVSGDHLPVGSDATPFSGVMDGDFHLVSNFDNTSGVINNGLFGYVDGAAAEIKNIAVKNAVVRGGDPSGALVGMLVKGTVENSASYGAGCYVYSAGWANHKGGLIGEVAGAGVVRDVFSTCRIGGTGIGIGGLIGHNEGLLINAYYANTTYPISGSNRTAGLIGWNTSSGQVQHTFTVADVAVDTSLSDVALHIGTFQGTVSNSFFDSSRSVTNSGTGGTTTNGTGIDTAAQPGYFFDKQNPPLSSWDFSTVWLQRAGNYPILIWLDGR